MKQKIKKYIRDWEQKCYFNGIPEEAPVRLEQLNKVPSYRQICMAIMKNDTQLKTLGFNPVKPKSYHLLKRIELDARNKPKQLKLF
jgi:predicted phosphoadenosine phosphosulfate sulfurtransferase